MEVMQARADEVNVSGDGIAYVDEIQTWPLAGVPESEIDANLDRYAQLIRTFRSLCPDVDIGLYSVLPKREYWASIKAQDDSEYVAWQAHNDRVSVLVAEVDFLAPSIYTFYGPSDGLGKDQEWIAYADSNVSEAKRIGQGKPIYPFMWPQYHNSNTYTPLGFIEPSYWYKQVEEAAKGFGNGVTKVIVWGGWDFDMPGRMTWDDDAQWWTILKSAIEGQNV